MPKTKILNNKSMSFLKEYLNNAAPTGHEWEGQKLWMNYLRPYVDEFITDSYGSEVGVLNHNQKYKVVIEGHADERGTREYNLALGERRANAAKDYLMTYGVSGKRISVISYGKEKPVNPASSPLAWSQNRRSVTIKAN